MCSTDFLRFLLYRLQSSSNCLLTHSFRDTEKKRKKLVSGYENEKLREKILIKRSRKVILALKAFLEFFCKLFQVQAKTTCQRWSLLGVKKKCFSFLKFPTFFWPKISFTLFLREFFSAVQKKKKKKIQCLRSKQLYVGMATL